MTSNLYTDLKQQILNIALCDGVYDIGISDLKICKRSKTSNLKKCFYDAMILFMVQGEKQTVVNQELEEAMEVLIALGYKQSEVDKVVKKLTDENLDTNGYVKKALSLIVK